jgi:hypothetical protein
MAKIERNLGDDKSESSAAPQLTFIISNLIRLVMLPGRMFAGSGLGPLAPERIESKSSPFVHII